MTEAMTPLVSSLVPALASALLHFLWQGALLGLLAALVLALLRNARPQARYAVACVALLACVLLPAWTLVQALGGASAPGLAAVPRAAGGWFEGALLNGALLNGALLEATQLKPGATLRALAAPSPEALPWVVLLWASGAATLSLRLGCGWLWVQRLCRAPDALPRDDARTRQWQGIVDRLAPRLGVARAVVLRITRSGDSPVTAGWYRPMVLLPLAVATRLPVELVEALLAHELAHVRRHDYLVNLLQGVAEALLFYHPVVWWLSRRIRIERERAADELAAAALGDRRRLALALAELDRHRPEHPTATLTYAPAAHGGQLMSRIQHLVRPQRRTVAGALALPLIGLALTGAAFYAHARLAEPAAGKPAPVVAAKPLPAPAAKPGATVLADAGAPRKRAHESVALIEAGKDGITMSGSTQDIDEIKRAQRSIGGDFVWFRRDGRSWVVRDAATVARVRQAWARTEALDAQMEALDARMQPHEQRMDALSARMEALSEHDASETPGFMAATAQLEALGERAEALGERQTALAERMADAREADRPRLEAEQQSLERQQQALEREMDAHEKTLESLNARMEAQQAPMEALSREMDAASRPMEAIGREMETLGRQVERESEAADARVRALLDEAWRQGRAENVK